MKLLPNAQFSLRNLSPTDKAIVERFLRQLESDESRVLRNSNVLRHLGEKRYFLGRPNNKWRVIYYLHSGDVCVEEILTKERVAQFLAKTKGLR